MRTAPAGRHLPLDGAEPAFVRTAGCDRGRPPVLLLHGLGATGALNWEPCFAPLARRTRVVALDHPGHGRGPRVGNRFRLAHCADHAAAVIRALDLGPAIVVGYSMGGPIAQLLARRHPDLVAGLVLSATARDFRGRPVERLRFGVVGLLAALARVGPPALAPGVVPLLPGRWRPLGRAVAELRRHEPAALLAATAELGRFTSRRWIHTIHVPAAVIVHEHDRLVPPNRQRKLAAELPDADTIEVPLDHVGVAREPAVFVPALLRAYDAVARRTTARPAARPLAS